jgi:APA family basic amino acid/polyamine antiporter
MRRRRRYRLERVLDVPSLAAVAFAEVASSVYFALGIVALYALGLTPWVLLAAGAVFLVVALAYAEGTAAMREPGGAAAFVRRAFNDPAAFAVGWLLFLDYLIVIALAALFVPHYLGTALEVEELTEGPWDVVVGVIVIASIATLKLVRRTRMYRGVVWLAVAAAAALIALVALALAVLFSPGDVTAGPFPDLESFAFGLALATLAYTGLETVANLAAEARRPGRALPRSLFVGLGGAVAVATLVGLAWIAARPPGEVLGAEWTRAPLVGVAEALSAELPRAVVDVLRVVVGVSGALVLVAAITTAFSGAGRLAHALARREMLPHAFARLSPRTLLSPHAIAAVGGLAVALLSVAAAHGEPAPFLATLYSFGILIAFTAAQLAVLRLRVSEPALRRPFRVPLNVGIGRAELPLPTAIGAFLTAALWVAAVATHDAARYAGVLWLVVGSAVYVISRTTARSGLFERVEAPRGDLVPGAEGTYRRILVPLKGGVIGDEVLATAIKLAQEHDARVDVLHVIRLPFEQPLDAPAEAEEREAELSVEEARELAADHGVAIDGHVVRARSIGEAIVAWADEDRADLIVLGSAPRWRRQSRFFSPTVDYVLRRAPCEVMVVAYPQGVLGVEG